MPVTYPARQPTNKDHHTVISCNLYWCRLVKFLGRSGLILHNASLNIASRLFYQLFTGLLDKGQTRYWQPRAKARLYLKATLSNFHWRNAASFILNYSYLYMKPAINDYNHPFGTGIRFAFMRLITSADWRLLNSSGQP